MDILDKYFGKTISGKPEKTLAEFARYEIRAVKPCLNKEEIRRLRCFLVADPYQYRDIYGMISLHANSDRAIELIRLCAPLVYATKGIDKITHSSETWKKSVLLIDYGFEDINESCMRLYFSALELVFMRAAVNELRALIAFLVDDTNRIIEFKICDWEYRKPDFF